MTTSTTPSGLLNIRNEKAQKLLGWAALGLAGFAVWTWMLPWVLFTLVGTLKVVVIGTILVLFATVVLDARFRWMLGYLVQRFISLFASAVINTDPIGIMKHRLREARSIYEELLSSIGELRGAVDKAHRDRTNYQEELDRAKGRLSAATKRPGTTRAMVATEANIANRRERSIAGIDREIAQGESMIALLERYAAQSEAYIRDMDDQIDFTARERKRLKTAFSAFKQASNILKGKSVGGEMYDDALDVANEQAAAMIGEMKQFISESRGALEGFELDQDGAVEQAMASIQARSADSLMLEYKPGEPAPISLTGEKVPVSASARADIDRFLGSR